MKKFIVLGCFIVGMCLLSGCNGGTNERMKTGEEIAADQAEKAQDAVDQNNSSVEEFNEQTDLIDGEY